MDAGLFFHIVFPILYMGIFHLLCCVHGNIPRRFQWLHEQFPWKYFYGYGYKYCNLGVTGSNPKQNKNSLQGKKIQCTLQVSPIQKVEAQTNIQISKKKKKSPTGYRRLSFFAQINLILWLSVNKHSHNS
jgi:hypothetical protein